MTIQQLPDFAFRSASDYGLAMDQTPPALRRRCSASGIVDVLERLSVFQMFRRSGSAPPCSCWSSRSSSARSTGRRACGEAVGRDPRRPARAVLRSDPAGSRRDDRRGRRRTSVGVLRRNGFRVREAADDDGRRCLYGDRNQYTKMATLLTHLGLILFLVAAAVTSRLGDEQGLVVARRRVADRPADRDAGPAARQEPRLRCARPRDRAGERLHDGPRRVPGRRGDRAARRSASTIRCRSAATRSTRTASGRRRTSSSATPPAGRCGMRPVPLTDAVEGRPYGILSVPGPRHRPAAPARRRSATGPASSSSSPIGRSARTRTARRSSRTSRGCRWPSARPAGPTTPG